MDHSEGGSSHGHGILAEMVDPDTGAFLGNLPQGLSHLAHLMALSVLNDEAACD